MAWLDGVLGDRLLITRVDRIELSKNLLRGFAAFDLLLERHPELRERVVFGAFGYPSRQGVPAYAEYRTAVDAEVARLNRRWGTDDWQPVLYDDSDDYPRSVAGLRRADVLLVNPIRDGLNLVAKEGPLVNDRDAVLLLSTEAGAWDELSSAGVAGPPLRHRRHRRCAPPGADPRPRHSEPSTRPPCGPSRRDAPRRTGWPTRSARSTPAVDPDRQLVADTSASRRSDRTRRAVDHDVGPVEDVRGRLRSPHRDAGRVHPGGGQPVEPVVPRQVAQVVGQVADRGQTRGQPFDRRALVGRHGRVQLDRLLGRPHLESRAGRLLGRPHPDRALLLGSRAGSAA